MIKTLIINILVSISVMIGGLFAYNIYLEKNVKEELVFYVVDVEKLYQKKQEDLKILIESGAGDVEVKKYKNDFVQYVKDTEAYLTHLSTQNNIVIFNKKALFTNKNTKDITQRIIDEFN